MFCDICIYICTHMYVCIHRVIDICIHRDDICFERTLKINLFDQSSQFLKISHSPFDINICEGINQEGLWWRKKKSV